MCINLTLNIVLIAISTCIIVLGTDLADILSVVFFTFIHSLGCYAKYFRTS